MNAAIWFGAAAFFTLGAQPAAYSQDMQQVLGQKNFDYFSVAIGQLIAVRYWHFYLACAVISLLHLFAEWVYLGKSLQREWRWCLAGLLALGLLSNVALQPKLLKLNQARYTQPQNRVSAERAFQSWSVVNQGLNWLTLGLLGAYFWRMANPPAPARFISATKFRS